MRARHYAAVVAAAVVLLGAGGWGAARVPQCDEHAQAVYVVARPGSELCVAVAICRNGRWVETVNPLSCHRVRG